MTATTHKKTDRSPRTILICCMRLIGDVILTTPLIKILKMAYPDAVIDFLVNRKTGEFLEKDPRVRKVIYSEQFDVDKNVHIEGESYVSRIFRQYDMAINLNYADRGNIATIMAGRRWRVGFWGGKSFTKNIWKKLFLTHPIEDKPNEHIAYRCKVVADALGLAAERLECKVFWDKEDERKVAEALAAGRLENGRYFVVHPFARGRHKLWRMERFVEVSDAIAAKYGLQPVWTSSPLPEEVEQLKATAETCRFRPITVPGSFTLNQMACLLAGAAFYLGLDTAISHLAATTGIPMVALYGPTPAVHWAPWDNAVPAEEQRAIVKGKRPYRNIVMIQEEFECVPCGKKGCNDKGEKSPCLLEIDSGQVIEAVDSLLCPLNS